MRDVRYEQLADTLVRYSTELAKGDHVWIDVTGHDNLLAAEVVKKAYEVQAYPFVYVKDEKLHAHWAKQVTKPQLELICEERLTMMKKMDAYIGIRQSGNVYESASVSPDNQILMNRMLKPITDYRVKNTKWCVLRYPNESFAQLAGMNTQDFEDFYFQVCNLDYKKMSKAMDALVDLMNRTNTVHIKGPGTDLRFSIEGLSAVKCDGKMNIPDGEVFTAPVKHSVEGTITFNTPAVADGYTYENIRFEVNKGKIVKAYANDTERIQKKLDTDEGARYFGEFAIGMSPLIKKPMKDTLFDEKIMGSIHLTPGSCYEEADNGNHSAIHWDLVLIQTLEHGGGEIWFDDRLIRKDGTFVIESLLDCNPDRLA